MSALDTFVADCLRIIAARKRREREAWRERELAKVMRTLKEV